MSLRVGSLPTVTLLRYYRSTQTLRHSEIFSQSKGIKVNLYILRLKSVYYEVTGFCCVTFSRLCSVSKMPSNCLHGSTSFLSDTEVQSPMFWTGTLRWILVESLRMGSGKLSSSRNSPESLPKVESTVSHLMEEKLLEAVKNDGASESYRVLLKIPCQKF